MSGAESRVVVESEAIRLPSFWLSAPNLTPDARSHPLRVTPSFCPWLLVAPCLVHNSEKVGKQLDMAASDADGSALFQKT